MEPVVSYHCISPIWIAKAKRSVPCGKCNFDLQRKRLDWCFRLQWEQKVANSSHFITLTYAEENLPKSTSGKGNLYPKHMELFCKSLRNLNAKYQTRNSKPLRYYLAGEYGTEGERPHYHVILFNAEKKTIRRLGRAWDYGKIDVGGVTPASIGYVTGYTISRAGDYGDRVTPFSRMSRRPGLGSNYLTSNAKWHKNGFNKDYRFYALKEGNRMPLPRFYKEKIFTKWDREKYNIQLEKEVQKSYDDAISYLAQQYRDPHQAYYMIRTEKHDEIQRLCKNSRHLN